MGQNEAIKKQPKLLAVLLAASLAVPFSAHGTIHMVAFGGSLGHVYSPSSFSAKIGDSIEWHGNFSMHPLQSTTIPSGAAAWGPINSSTDTIFFYVIKVPGTFNYECTVHASLGMVGQFTVTSSAVLPREVPKTALPAAQTLFFSGQTYVRLSLPSPAMVNASLFTIGGRKIANLASTQLSPGIADIPVRNVAPGAYIIRLAIGNTVMNLKTFISR